MTFICGGNLVSVSSVTLCRKLETFRLVRLAGRTKSASL